MSRLLSGGWSCDSTFLLASPALSWLRDAVVESRARFFGPVVHPTAVTIALPVVVPISPWSQIRTCRHVNSPIQRARKVLDNGDRANFRLRWFR